MCFRHGLKKGTSLLVVLAFILSLSGCTVKEAVSKTRDTLWVITELSNSDGMNYQADMIAARMMEKYPGLEIKLDILPTDANDREIKLKQLRTQIMSGNGPDVYLLPTGTELISDEPQWDVNIPIEPLFSDVNQAMRNGAFWDISEYYVPDDSLKQEVMDAGVLADKRLVIPLRFRVPVVYSQPDLCREYGISEELLNSDFLTLVEGILNLPDAETAAIGLKFPEGEAVLKPLLDYGKGEVLVSQQQIADYMKQYRLHQKIAAISTRAMLDRVDWERLERQWDAILKGTLNPVTNGQLGSFSRREYDYRPDWHDSPHFWPLMGTLTHEHLNMISQYVNQTYHWLTCGIAVYTGDLSDI